MKKIVLPIILGLILFSVTANAVDDKVAIKKVISGEHKAYIDKDFGAWSEYWLHESYVCHTTINSFGVVMKKSWDSLSTDLKKYFENEEISPELKIADDYDIIVSGDMASAEVSKKSEFDLWGVEKVVKFKTSYLLKKVYDGWKIVSLTQVNNTSYENSDFMTEFRINMIGYQLLDDDKIDEAIRILELNKEFYPESANTWDSLAEAYMKKGDNEKAIEFYRKSIEINPQNTHAEKMIESMNKE